MESTSPSDLIINLARGYFAPRCLYLIAELGVADHIGDAPCPLNELAEKTATDPNSFARVLDLLETIGVFERNGDGYQHTAASRLLRSDNPNSLRSFVRMIGSEMCWSCFGSLMHSVQSGAPTLTQGLFGYLRANPEMGKVFDEAMTGKSRQEIAALVSAYDFSGFDVIADVGGGQGHLLQAVLTVAPKARGILFDLPQVVDQEIASARLSIQSGDFFKDQIPQADVYLVSRSRTRLAGRAGHRHLLEYPARHVSDRQAAGDRERYIRGSARASDAGTRYSDARRERRARANESPV